VLVEAVEGHGELKVVAVVLVVLVEAVEWVLLEQLTLEVEAVVLTHRVQELVVLVVQALLYLDTLLR
jgi:hypothetical protein